MRKKADESRLVKTAREKLRKRLIVEKNRFSPEALSKVRTAIRASIQRVNQPDFLEKRTFSLFDENLHSAKTKSKAILKLQTILMGTKKGLARR